VAVVAVVSSAEPLVPGEPVVVETVGGKPVVPLLPEPQIPVVAGVVETLTAEEETAVRELLFSLCLHRQ
jgi:hypothetical protein